MDAVISKQLLTVNAVQRFIQHQNVATLAHLPGLNAQFIEFIAKEGHRITRKPLKDIRFPKEAIVGAVMHDEAMVIPRGDTLIEPGDKVVIFAHPRALDGVENLFKD